MTSKYYNPEICSEICESLSDVTGQLISTHHSLIGDSEPDRRELANRELDRGYCSNCNEIKSKSH